MNVIKEEYVEKILGSVLFNEFRIYMKGKTIPIITSKECYVYVENVYNFICNSDISKYEYKLIRELEKHTMVME